MERPIRRLRLEHSGNVRDLGGYETEDGRVTRFGCLLRGGGLHNLNTEEWKKLTDYGVRTVIDLRSDAELEMNPDQVPEGVEWFHCPLQRSQIDNTDLSNSAAKAFRGSLTQGYLDMVTENGDLLAAAVKQLVSGLLKGAVLFHCTAGKDRTGVLASAILSLCGVSAEDIIADYEVTYTYNRKSFERMLAMMGEEAAEQMRPYLSSRAETMEAQVKNYRELDLKKHLDRYGVAEEEIETLKKRFLD